MHRQILNHSYIYRTLPTQYQCYFGMCVVTFIPNHQEKFLVNEDLLGNKPDSGFPIYPSIQSSIIDSITHYPAQGHGGWGLSHLSQERGIVH